MALPIDVAATALIAVPAIIALASGGKDQATRWILGGLALIAVVLAASAYIGDLHRLCDRLYLLLVLPILAAVLAIAALVRVPNRTLGALMLVGALVVLARVFDLLGGWAIV